MYVPLRLFTGRDKRQNIKIVRSWLWAAPLSVLLAAVGIACEEPEPEPVGPTEEPQRLTIGGSRPATVYVPSGIEKGDTLPMVILLHGFQVGGQLQELFFRLEPRAEERHFVYVVPNGTIDAEGRRFWNATDACCDFDRSGVDDSGYLAALIHEAVDNLPVDDSRVYLIGQSNGGFMAHRFACDHADMVAAIVSVGGAAPLEPCKPASPVAMLQVHGTVDDVIRYSGGNFGMRDYPSAPETAAMWASINGCVTDPKEEGASLDLVGDSQMDTVRLKYDGCKPGAPTELWRMDGEPHIPNFNDGFRNNILDFVLAQSKVNPDGG